MLQNVTRVFVGNTAGTANSGNTIATLASGDLLLVDEFSIPITTAAAAAAAKTVFVLQGTEKVGFPLSSQKLRREQITKFTEQVYAPSVAQVDTIDLAGMEAGKQYKITVIFKDERRLIANKQTRREIYHPTASTGFSLATELAKLVTKINNDKVLGGLVIATVNGSTIVLTGQPVASKSILNKYDFVVFQTLAAQIPANSHFGEGNPLPVAKTAAAFPGSGLGVQVRELEHASQGKHGVSSYREFDRAAPSLFAAGSTNYDVYHLAGYVEHQGNSQEIIKTPVQTTVAVATNSAQGNAFQGLLEAFVSGLAVTAPAGD